MLKLNAKRKFSIQHCDFMSSLGVILSKFPDELYLAEN